MISKIDIKDYEKQMKEGKYEDVYKDVVDKSMELVKEIGKLKILNFQMIKKVKNYIIV